MRKVLGILTAVCLLLMATGSLASAEGGHEIPFAIEYQQDVLGRMPSVVLPDGKCMIPRKIEQLSIAVPANIIVRNENDTIIATKTLNDGVGTGGCKTAFTLPVPLAEFYSVWFDDVRLMTVSADRLPTDPIIFTI